MKTPILLFVTFLTLILVESCNSINDKKSEDKVQSINKDAPFYTNKLPEGSPRVTKQYDSSKLEAFFPFIIYKDGSYMVAAEIDDKKIDSIYQHIFAKYNYEGNGYNWASLIKLILKKEYPDMEKHLQFDPEADGFYLFADSESEQRLFASSVSKIFSDTTQIDSYLKSADRKKIENYNPAN